MRKIKWLKLGFMLSILLCSPAISSTLTNGNFSSGFDDWNGWLISDGDVTPTAPYFMIDNGAAVLSNDQRNWEVSLFQEIDIPDQALSISFDYEWFFTSIDNLKGDEAFASLWSDVNFTNLTADLFANVDFTSPTGSGQVQVDISSFSGTTQVLEFLTKDNDFNERDWLKINNITINVVPEPGTMMLMMLGLLCACKIRNRH